MTAAVQTTNNNSIIVEQAKFISKSAFIPDHYKNDVGACILAINSSQASGIPIMQVMAGSYIVHGKVSYYGQFVIGLVNRKFKSTLQFKYERDNQNKILSCQAWLKTKEGDVLEGPKVTQELVIAEWAAKNKKWQAMPELMYMYRAGAFFARVYAPEVMFGGTVEGEVEDTAITADAKVATPPQIKHAEDSKVTNTLKEAEGFFAEEDNKQ